jgi:hypothetical protein
VRTDELIVQLARSATPITPLPPPGVRTLRWLLLAVACGVAGVTVFGARSDVLARLSQLDYLGIALLALLTSAGAVVVTLVLAIPGAERTPALRVSTLGILGVWAATMIWSVLTSGRGLPVSTDPHWPVCFMRVLIVGVLPAFALFAMVRRGFVLRPGWTSALAAVAAASIGALAAQLACPLDESGHGFLGHFVPVIFMAIVGLAAQRLLARPIR